MQKEKRAAALFAAAGGHDPAARRLRQRAAGRGAHRPGPRAAPGTVWQSERRKIDGVEGLMKAKAVSEGKLYFTTSVTDRGDL